MKLRYSFQILDIHGYLQHDWIRVCNQKGSTLTMLMYFTRDQIRLWLTAVNVCKQGIQLRKLCTTISGDTPSTKFPEYYEGEIPWITTLSLGPNHIDGSSVKSFITQEAIDNSATKLIPAGNILFGTRVGVGKPSLNDVDICTNQDIVAIIGINEDRFDRLFIKHVLDAYQPYFDSKKRGHNT